MRTLRVHIHRLAGLQLWSVAKYAAGRGADKVRMLLTVTVALFGVWGGREQGA